MTNQTGGNRLFDTDKWQLTSWHNGASYQLLHRPKGYGRGGYLSLFVQGDDATQFRDEWEALELAHPKWSTSEIFAELWQSYELAAQPTESCDA